MPRAWTRKLRPAIFAGLVVYGAGLARADCTAIDGEIREAITAGLSDKLPLLNARMLEDPTCPGDYRELTGRVMALAMVRGLEAKHSGVMPVEALGAAVKLGRPWQALYALGNAHYEKKSYAEAVRAYEAAIEDVRDERLNPKAPPKEVEVALFKRAYQARALADGYVEVAVTRGKRGGIASGKFRNFTVSAVPVPIRFGYNESTLTEDGLKAAADMLSYLNEQSAARVTLIGHTDPKGGEGYNKKLSLARAEALKTYLAGNGYNGEVVIEGKGEAERFEADDPSAYSEDELHAFDRRVEFVVE